MAVGYVSTDVADSSPNASTYTHSVTLAATGTDRGLFAVFSGRRAVVRTLNSATLDGVAGTVLTSLSIDGGANAISMGVVHWPEADLPSTAGAYDIIPTWSANQSNVITRVVEIDGASQTSVLNSLQTATATGQSSPATLGTTHTGDTGEFMLTFAGTASPGTDNPPNNTKPSAATLIGMESQGNLSTGSAYVSSISTSPETFDWSLQPEVLDPNIDALAVLSFIVSPSTGGTTVALTGLASTAEQGALTATGSAIVSLAGQESTAQQGTINVMTGTIVQLSGLASTAEQGVITAAGQALVTLNGQASTAEQGTVTVTTGTVPTVVELTGLSSTAEQGTISTVNANIITLVGLSSTAQQGTITVVSNIWTQQGDVTTTWTDQLDNSDTWTKQ